MTRSRRPIFIIPILMLSLLGHSVAAQKSRRAPAKKAAPTAPVRAKIAEGRYVLRKSGKPDERSFEQAWTMYKTGHGYDLEEQWIVGSAQAGGEPTIIDVSAEFASGLHPIRTRIGSDAERALTCELTASKCTCQSMGHTATLEVKGVYDFFSPSPWMLSSIVRRAKKIPDQVTNVQLVRMAGMTEQGPRLTAFNAEVQWVGDDEIDVDGKRFAASIYELKAAGSIPSLMVWVNADGIVLAMQDTAKQEQRMELSQFSKVGKF